MNIYIKQGMIDSHFHILEMIRKGLSVKELLSQLNIAGMDYLLDVGVNLDDFSARLSHHEFFPGLYFATGIHPNVPREEWPEDFRKKLMSHATHDLVKAVGETGLDFYRTSSNRHDQLELLDVHYQISRELGKPMIFHCRNAEKDLTEWILNHEFPSGAVLHCFPGDEHLGKAALSKGFMISFAGNFTYKNAINIRQATNWCPLENLLLETDAPYLAPVPKRGKDNHSGYIGHTYEAVALEYKIPIENLVKIVRENFQIFLGL